MATALSVWLAAATSATLSTANQLYASSGGSPTTTQDYSLLGTATGYGEVVAQGTASAWAASGSIGTPTGKGFFLDATTLNGQDLIAGSYTGNVRLASATGTGGTLGGTLTATIFYRVYKYSSGVYTNIITMSLAAQTINSTITTYSLSGSTGSATSFATGDKLYVDIWLNVTANANGATENIRLNRLTQDTTTFVGDTAATIVTPGYQATSGGVSLAGTLAGVGTLSGTTARKTALSKTLAGVGTLNSTLSASSNVHLSATLSGSGVIRGAISVPGVPAHSSPTYSVFIGGQSVYIIAGTLNVTNTIGRRGQASFMARTTTATHFQQYQPVTIYDATNTLAFSGYITQPQEQKPGFQNSLIHTITCVDQHYLADKRRIAATYTNKTCGYIAQDIVKTILSQEGVSVGMIYDGLTPSDTLYPDTTLYPGGNVGLVPSATFVYARVSDALDELVKAASASGVPYYWQIDQNKQLWFVPYTTVINSNIVDGSAIDQVLNPPYVQRQNPTYRNSQYILGGVAQTLTQTEVRKGDGNTQSWTMGYELSTAPTITVNGTGQTVGIKGASTGSQFYWAQGDNIIVQDSAQTKLISTDTLQVVYVGQYPSVIASQSAAQIAYQASVDGTSGIVDDAITDQTLTSIGNGLTEASQLLTRYGVQATLIQFSTLVSGYAQGQLITVNLPMHGLNNAQMLIENVQISDQTDMLNIWYQVTAVQGPYDTTWVQFFSSLLAQQAPANSINVGVTQSVTLLASFVGNVTPSCTLTVNVYACPLPSSSLFPGTGLFPC